MSAIDFITNEDQDLLESDTDLDFVEDVSDSQHIHDLLQLEPGELAYDPLIGVGIERNMNGKADGSLKKTIYLQLQADRYSVKQLLIDDEGNINIDAEREG